MLTLQTWDWNITIHWPSQCFIAPKHEKGQQARAHVEPRGRFSLFSQCAMHIASFRLKLRRIQAKWLDPIHRISAIFADNCNHPANPSYQIKIRSIILLGMAQHYWPSIWCWYTDQTEQNAVVQKMGFQIVFNHQNLQISVVQPASTASKVSLPGCPVVWLPPSEAFLISPTWTDGGKTDMKTVMVVVVQLSCIPGRWCTDTSICLHVFSLVRVKQDANMICNPRLQVILSWLKVSRWCHQPNCMPCSNGSPNHQAIAGEDDQTHTTTSWSDQCFMPSFLKPQVTINVKSQMVGEWLSTCFKTIHIKTPIVPPLED